MRYRRLNYRYAVVVQSTGPRPLAEPWPTRRFDVLLAQPHWRPAADIVEGESEFLLTTELAGVDIDEIEIWLYEDAIVVSGHRHLPAPGGVFHAAEIRQGPFRLEVTFPRLIDTESAEARYERGLLSIRAPKAGRRSQP